MRTFERERWVFELLRAPDMTRERLVKAFLEPPLHSTAYAHGFGTLYTAAYFPAEGRVEYHWPDLCWSQSFDDFAEGELTRTFREDARAA